MRVDFEFYATLRDAVGRRRLTREVPEGTTVGDALSAVAEEFPDLRALLFDAEGRIRPHVNVLRNDEPVHALSGADTPLSAGDTVGATPGVAGGRACTYECGRRGAHTGGACA